MRKILLYPRLLLIFLCLLIVKINFTDGAESRFSLHTIPSAENERKGLLSSAGDASSHQSAHVHGFGRRQLNDLSVLSQPTFAPTQFIPTPSINSASLSPDGRFFTMTFDSATNKGGSNSNSFVCSSFLQFTKNDVATCLWQDASTIAVYPDFSTADNVDGAVNVGSLVQLLSPNNIYSVLCDVKNLNPACNPASAQTLFLLGPTNPVAPSVSVVIPKTVSACSPLLVDLTGCSGDGQRGWKSIDIKVTSDNNNAQPAQIASYLTSKFTTKSPISVPSSLLTVDTNYVVTVELCNLLYGCTTGSTQFTVNSGSTSAPIVSLVGSTAASVFAKTPVSVTAPAYVVGCGGTTTSVGLTYSWQVLVGTTAVQVNQVVRGNSLSIPAFVLQTGQTYTIQVTVTDKGSGLKSTASTTFTVQVSALVANVNPSSMQLLRVGKSLTFNGGSSFDPDDINNDNGNLQYAWSCAGFTLNGRPHPDCTLTLSSSVTSPTLTVTANADAVNSTSTITLRVLKDKRNTTTSIRVKVIEGSAPLITIQTGTAAVTSVNTANSLLISGLVQSEFDVTCAWSVSPSTIILDKASLTGTTKSVTAGSPTLANLFLAGNSLGVRSTYVFTLSCLRSAATITVTTNGPPVGGLYSISPDTGIEMQQLFSATTSQWSDPDLPITYLFGFISPSNGLISTIQSRSSLAYAAGTLPGGKSSDAYLVTTVVYAFDALNSSSILNEAVAVTPLPEADVANTIALKLNATKGSTNLNDLKAVISVASSVISRVNCAAAPASLCFSLNRANCSATAGTCGACLDGFAGQQGDANTKCVNSASGTPPEQQCNPSDCSGHGSCKFYDRTTALEISSCSVLASCDPKCVCSSGFYGTSCALTASQLQDQQGLRSDLLTSLSYVIENEDTTAETVNNVVSSIAGIIQSANDVNTESVNTFSTIAQTTLTNAAGDSSITADSLSGLLGPTDAAIKAQTASTGADSALALGNSIISSFSTIVNRDAVAGLPATTLVYENFRFVQQTVDAKETVSLSAPQTDAERKTGAVPSKISVVSDSSKANASSVSLQVVQYNANLLSVPNKKYSGVVQAQFSTAGGHTVLLTMANTAGTIGPRRTDTKPLNYTTSCKTGDYGTYTYTCPVSNKQIVHKCHGIRGNLMTYCPVLATVCSSVDLTNASVGLNLDGYTCAVSNMTTSLITCKCYPSTRRRLDSQDILKETGVITACAMAQYTAYEVGETFQAAPELTSPEAIERALIVIVMFTVLWAGGLTLITGCFIRQRQLHQESLERKLDDAGKQQQNSENSSVEEIRERLTKYVDSVFPVIFYPGHLLLRLKDEIRRNHRYLMMFMLLEGELEGKKRFINGIQLLTIQSALMFLLALLYDIQSPSDDGTCVSFTVQSDCLNRKSVFDSSRSYCQWTDTPDTGATNCSFNTSDVSFQATIYIQVLVSVASALIMRPLYYLFDVLLAPNVDNMKAKLAEEAALKSIENVGANRQSMVGRMTRRVGRVANSVASMIKFAQPKQVDPKDLENMPVTLIPDEVEMVHTQAKAYFRKLTQREQQYASNNGNSNPEHGRKSVRFTMMKKIQFTYNEYLGKIESEHTEAAEKKWDELRALIKEQRGLLKPEELAEYDAQWGLDPNTGEFLVASAQDKKSKDVEKLIQKEIALVERSTQATIDRLNLAVDSHVGLELLHKFILDILGRDTPAARIFGNKTAEDFRRSSVKTRREKVVAAILITAANCLFVYYSILRGYVKGVDWQKSYLIACLVQMMLEIYLFETIECIWINVFVPSLVSSEVQRVNNLLLGIINDMCNKSIMGQKLIDDGKNYALDVTKYLFTSTRVAEVHPTLMESMMIRSYHTHLPGEISRKWTATGDQKVTSGCFSVSNHRENVSFPVAMIGSVILTLQIAAMTPFDIQKMFLRFVQPFLYGGLVLLGQDIVSNPIYIAITVVVLAVFAGLLLYQYWKSEAESEDTRMSKVQPISPVPVAEEAKPFDPRDADALAKKKEMEYLKQQRENLRQKANQWAISESKSHSSDSESNHGKEYNIRTAETAAAARRLNSGNKKSSVRKPAVPAPATSISQDGKDEKSGYHQWESSEEKSEMGAGESYMFSSSESPSKAQGNATNKDDDDDDLGLLHKPKITSVAKSTTNGSNTRSAELDSFTSQSLDDSYHPVK